MRGLLRFLFGTFRGRLVLSVAMVHAVLMTVLVAELTARQRDILLERQAEEAKSLSETLAASGAGWIVSADVSGLDELVDALRAYPSVSYVLLTDEKGRVLAATDPSRRGQYVVDMPRDPRSTTLSRGEELADAAAPAMIGARHVGWARVGVGRAATAAEFAAIARSAALYALAAIAIGAISAWFISGRLMHRFDAVLGTIDAVRAGDAAARSSLVGYDEAAVIAREFNTMLDALAERDAHLRASEERYRSLIAKVQAGIVVHDRDGAVIASNPRATDILGLPAEQLRAKALVDPAWHFVRDDGSTMRAEEYPVSRVLATRAPVPAHVVGVARPDSGEITWALVAAEPDYDANGEISQVVVSFVDITDRKRAEEALREGEKRYHLVFEHSPVSLWEEDFSAVRARLDLLRVEGVTDVEAYLTEHPEVVQECAALVKLVDVNRAALALHGASTKEDLLAGVVGTFTAESLETFRDELMCLWNGTTEMKRESAVRTLDGDVRHVTVHFAVTPDAQGALSKVIVSLADITEPKRIEQERLANLRFFESMDRVNVAMQRAGTLEDVMNAVLDTVLSVFGADRAFLLYPCDPDAPSWSIPFERNKPEYPGAHAADLEVPMTADVASTLRELLASDRPLTFGPGAPHPLPADAAQRFGFRSFISVILRPKLGEPWQLGIHQCSYARVWTAEEERLLREIGRRVADVLTVLISRRDLQESEQRYRRIVDTAAEGIWVMGPDLITTSVNARMLDILGYSADEIVGRPMTDFMFEEDRPDHALRMTNRKRGVSEIYERRFRRKDGGTVWTQISATPIYDDARLFQGAFAMHTDLTKRKQAELALLRLNRELRAISNCNQILVRAESEQALLDSICRVIRDEAGYGMVWVGYPGEDGASLRPVARYGAGSEPLAEPRSLAMRAVWSGQVQCVQDLAVDARAAEWSDATDEREYRSVIALPLKDDKGAVFGVLEIFSGEPNAFNSDELRLMEELAGDLAFGIGTLRTRAEHGRSERIVMARLRLLQFAAAHSLDELLEETLNEAEKLSGSLIGFFHFVQTDQRTIELQSWSTRTKTQSCKAEGKGKHYDLAQAGVWADCLRHGRAVVHNDYAALPDTKGLPPYHAEVIREIVVPIFRAGKVVAIVGVGNKPVDYTLEDVDSASLLADQAWDIAERKRAEENLRQYQGQLEDTIKQRTAELLLARDAAEAANRAKSLFLANMSHELRTPLNAILGFSSIVRRAPELPPALRENLDIINRSGEHLLVLINDVLEMAKIEAGRQELEIAPFDLGEMVRDVADMMHLRAAEKGLALTLDQSSRFPRFIRGDEARLRQILLNLVSNAVKFTDRGGVTIRLGVEDGAAERLRIEVEDTGRGVGPDDQKRLFQPFVQLGEGGARQGTGLGLSITRQFVQLMGGTIGVKSAIGHGSLFWVELPVKFARAVDVGVGREAGKDAREVVGVEPGQRRYRILIAEDQHENQVLLARLMGDIGMDVKTVEDGAECVAAFEQWRPDLIWMDKTMPIMDGVEATRRIRTLPGGRDVKIVAVTASAFKEQQQVMLDAGMDAFLRKPYRGREIYDCLARLLDVKYVFGPPSGDGHGARRVVTAPMMAVLPTALRDELRDALERLDSERISAVLQEVKEVDAALGRTLSALAEDFEYPSMLSALVGGAQ